jgi:uncharacterized protein GlcG (DUF336 family)
MTKPTAPRTTKETVMSERFINRSQVSLASAQALVTAAVEHAKTIGIAISVVVADSAGNVIASARMDDAPLGAMRLATDKAYTAALWQIPSGDLRVSSQPGGDDWGVTSTEGGRVVVYEGGLPVFTDNGLAGAVGVSGGTGAQDAECAQTAITSALG